MKYSEKSDNELIEICKNNSGEYLPSHHPSTSWATTYSNAFVEAATELYNRRRREDPKTATTKLYIVLRDAKVPACRGGLMTYEKVEYLVKRRINKLLYEKATGKRG